jgi:transglutaminase-like putative cysteine protease
LNYDVRHLTRYRYEAPVAVNTCTLRLLLRSLDGQSVLESRVDVTPPPTEWSERADIFGNRVARMRIERAHRELVIRSSARVEVNRPAPPTPGLTPAWETVASDAAASASLAADSPAFALYGSRLVTIFEDATRYARASFRPRRPIYEAAIELNERIRRDFTYDARATGVTTSPAAAFAKRSGVCQDFAHIMIAGLRGLGLPALYVSGYIRTVSPHGEARLAGADASHAWASVWCGQQFGWLGLDPTNATAIGDDHIVIAIGRDYADAAPVEGVILSSGGQRLDVAVDVIPIPG